MSIILQVMRMIDDENGRVNKRITPDAFKEYVKTLVAKIRLNKSIRTYKTRFLHTEVIAYDSNGNLYNCWQKIGSKGYCIGNVYDGLDTPCCTLKSTENEEENCIFNSNTLTREFKALCLER